jgi:isocitrate dehydrogenase
MSAATSKQVRAKKALVGVDVYLDWADGTPDELAARLQRVNGDGLTLSMISNRGTKVWPEGLPETLCTDHWRCRFLGPGGQTIKHEQIATLLQRVAAAGLDFIQTENLCTFDGEISYSLTAGQ